MDKYKVEFSILSKKDMLDIFFYIDNYLGNPFASKKIKHELAKKVASLSFFPDRHPIIEEESLKDKKCRKIHAKNYIIVYRVFEDTKIVRIERIIHANQSQILTTLFQYGLV